MSRTTKVEVAEGTVVLVKVAEGASAPDLRAEGERLRAAAHPGVVGVLASTGDAERWELRVGHGGRPVNLLHPVSAEQVAAIAASVATTLADLHDRGIVHGRLATRHVLVGHDASVQLCGFGPEPAEAAPEDDVAAVGALITELLGTREELEPLPESRWRRRRAWSGVARRALLSIADQACTEPAGRRPTARRLAATIAEVVPGATIAPSRPAARGPAAVAPAMERPQVGLVHAPPAHGPHSAGPASPRSLDVRRFGRAPDRQTGTDAPPASPRAAWRPAVVAIAGAVLLAAGAWRSLSPGAPEAPTAPPPAADIPCAVLEPGSGACLPVTVEGTSVSVGTATFRVGQPGDHVVVGDWNCDGLATAALRRPSTGEIFVFPHWAAAESVEVRASLVVPDSVDLRVAAGACGPLEVVRADGSIEPVVTGGAS